MMEKLLTIVIPAYNMEALLPRCLDSICTEKVMNHVQVLVVNDGSKDRTLEIARSYESRYPHCFTVIDKSNGNYGSCMNVGLANAKGKYFRTLDADDWYDTEAYEKFVDELEKTEADMLMCEKHTYYEKDNKLVHDEFEGSLTLNKDIPIQKELWAYDHLRKFESVTCICYKTQVLINCGMKWSENVFYSDTEYCYFPLAKVKTIRFIPLPVYIYLIGRNDQSMSPQNIARNFHSFYVVSKQIVGDFVRNANPESELYPLQKKYVYQILQFFYSSLLYHGYKYKKEVDEIDNILELQPMIYDESNNISKYCNYRYIYEYRFNKIKFTFIRVDYRIRSFLHSILR